MFLSHKKNDFEPISDFAEAFLDCHHSSLPDFKYTRMKNEDEKFTGMKKKKRKIYGHKAKKFCGVCLSVSKNLRKPSNLEYGIQSFWVSLP